MNLPEHFRVVNIIQYRKSLKVSCINGCAVIETSPTKTMPTNQKLQHETMSLVAKECRRSTTSSLRLGNEYICVPMWLCVCACVLFEKEPTLSFPFAFFILQLWSDFFISRIITMSNRSLDKVSFRKCCNFIWLLYSSVIHCNSLYYRHRVPNHIS